MNFFCLISFTGISKDRVDGGNSTLINLEQEESSSSFSSSYSYSGDLLHTAEDDSSNLL
jgi:hypothetical protein